MENSSVSDLFGEVISSYTRTDALDDGALIDVTSAAKEVGITYPVALTQGAWTKAVAMTKAAARACNDERARLHDVVRMLKYAIKSGAPTQPHGDGQIMAFQLRVVTTSVRQSLITLHALVGPGDNMEPVITVMLLDED